MLAEKIKTLRVSQGLNQTEFAKRLFVTPGAVSQWETGRTVPDTKTLIMMAKTFRIPLNYFSDAETTETELITSQVLTKLGDLPKTAEARILSKGVDQLPKEQRERALNVFRAMFSPRFESLFTQEESDDDSRL